MESGGDNVLHWIYPANQMEKNMRHETKTKAIQGFRGILTNFMVLELLHICGRWAETMPQGLSGFGRVLV